MDNINKIPIEKKEAIIKAGLQVFSENEYKKAITEDIAKKAGISKGLLFYYFKNKKELYNYIFEDTFNILEKYILDEEYKSIEDFFELIEYATEKKMEIFTQYPYLFDFFLKAMYDPNNILVDKNKIYNLYNKSYDFLSNIDESKFKEDISAKEIFDMLIYLTEGYTNIKLRNKEEIVIEEFMEEFKKWKNIIIKSIYKEG